VKTSRISINVVKSEQKCRTHYMKTQVGFIVVGDVHSPKRSLLPTARFLYCYQRHVAKKYLQKALFSSTVKIVTRKRHRAALYAH